MTQPADHRISVVMKLRTVDEVVGLTKGGWTWACSCGASGYAHDDHQVAMNHGIIHTWIEAPAKEQVCE